MTKSEMFKLAHVNTKEVRKIYKEVNYRCQFSLELKELYSKKEMNKEIKFNLKGSPKQIKWANKILQKELEVLKTMEKIRFEDTKYKTIERFNFAKETIYKAFHMLRNENASFIIEHYKKDWHGLYAVQFYIDYKELEFTKVNTGRMFRYIQVELNYGGWLR